MEMDKINKDFKGTESVIVEFKCRYKVIRHRTICIVAL
jgi:hypothetical protein